MEFEVLINKENKLDKDYVPKDLIITDENENNFHQFIDPNHKPMISKKVYPYFLKMQEDALKEGYNIILDSGYRSYEYQLNLWNNYIEKYGLEKTKKLVAPPGASEHQSGLAFDVAFMRNNQFVEHVTDDLSETKWMMKNAHKYGFILRYPKGKENITGYGYEPWHYRFVGIKLATKLYNENITLEEYYLMVTV